MTSLISWIPPAAITALGWALIHFLWQAAAMAALAAGLMRSCRQPSTRYLVGVVSLVLLLAAPLITFVILLDGAAPIAFAQTGAGAMAPNLSGLAFSALRLGNAVTPGPLLRVAPLNLLPWLVEAWACGVALLSLRFTGSFLLLGQAHRGHSGIPGARLLALCQEVQQRLGIHRTIRYLECRWLQAPAGFGCLRPVILLPLAALTGLSEEQLRAVIAHELAHIRRWDFAVNLFQVAVETLLFYHPAIWWLNRRIRAEREICCDEIAVQAYGNPLEYARALAYLAEWRNAPAMAMAINQGMLMDRIQRLVRGERFDARSFVAGMAGSLLLLTASIAGGNILLAGGDSIGAPVHQNILPVLTRSGASEIARLEAITPIIENRARKKTLAARSAARTVVKQPRAIVVPASLPFPAATPEMPDAIPAVQPGDSTQLPAMKDAVYRSVAADMSEMLAKMMLPVSADDQYPAPALVLNASHSTYEWEWQDASNYCDQYAQETVVQGANRPFTVDDAARQRYAFFYWHCMLRNAQVQREYVDPYGPAYSPVGTASADRPVNVAGTWAVSFPPWPAARSCTFTQTGNSISGTCARSEGGGVAHGVVDGRQVRWSWQYLDDEKNKVELDFIGMFGPDGSMSGQSIAFRPVHAYQIQSFTAVPGGSATQVAYQK